MILKRLNQLINNYPHKHKIHFSYFVIFLASFYLCLFNLDRITLWHDEAVSTFYGKVLLTTGSNLGFDGRHVLGGNDFRALNEELKHIEPPVIAAVSAISMGIFGIDIFGSRFLHTFLGFFGFVLFFFYLRLFFKQQKVLLLLMLCFTALSVDLIMFFRNARYYGELFFFLMLLIYAYEMSFRTKEKKYYVLLILAGCGGFLSHYPMGTANMLAVAIWHCIYRFKETSIKEYLIYTLAGIIVVSVGLGYFQYIGVLSLDLNFSKFSAVDHDNTEEFFLVKQGIRLLYYASFVFESNWITWVVLLLVIIYLSLRKFAPEKEKIKEYILIDKKDDPFTSEVAKVFVFGIILLITNSLCSVQDLVFVRAVVDSRYFFTVIPFFLILNAAFINYVYLKQKFIAGLLFFILITSNFAAYPFLYKNFFTREPAIGFNLIKYAVAIHTPYYSFLDAAIDYLKLDANDNDSIYTPQARDRETLITLIGDQYLICCNVQKYDNEHVIKILAKHDLHSHITANPVQAKYLIFFDPNFLPPNIKEIEKYYKLVYTSSIVGFEHTHRPELNLHWWEPLKTNKDQIFIYRKREQK